MGLSRVVTVLFPALTLLASTAFAEPNRRAPKSVLHYEELEGIEDSPGAAAGAERIVTFHAFGRRFDLVLERNPIFRESSEDVWTHGHGPNALRRRGKPEAVLYKGKVHGEGDSWVRASVRAGLLDGVIGSGGDLYFVEPAARFFRQPTDLAMVVYRLSDTTSDLGPGSCALENPAIASALEAPATAAGAGDTRALSTEFQALSATSLKEVDLAIVADYQYYLAHGSASAADMQSLVNQVDGIFESELGLTVRIARTVVHTAAADPFSETTDPEALLNELSSYKASSTSPIYGSDLAQLFTSRDLTGSTVGIAWMGALCDRTYGASLVQDFTTTSKSLTILSAHEMGHNLAAPHDTQAGSSCESTPFGYIMYPTVSSTLNLAFSSCSKSSIAPEIASATCLATVSPTPPSCSYALSPASASVGSGGGGGSVAVTAGTGCAWTAGSSSSWLTITSGASGSGNGTVAYSAAANPGPSSRTGSLTIAGNSFTVTQAAPTAASITVTSPNGGQTWPIGAVRSITWQSSGVTGYVKIEVSRNGGSTWTVLWATATNDGSQSWTVTGPATTRARFRVSSASQPAVADTSNADFRIGGGIVTVIAPNGGESWTVGSQRQISWTSANLAGNVAIDLTRNGGASWQTLTSSTANDGSHVWTVTSPTTTSARIRVRSVNDPAATDTSNASFRIR